MRLGLKVGSTGSEVARLHRALTGNGFPIAKGELTRKKFGPSTLKALHGLQQRGGLRELDRIDAPTLDVLLRLEQSVTINVNESGTLPAKPKPDPTKGIVHGKLVDGDGIPIARTKVSLFSKAIRAGTLLNDATTNDMGQYSIAYRRTRAFNLVARVHDERGDLIAESAAVFAAADSVRIDLTTAKDGIIRSPSRFTTLIDSVAAQQQNTPLADLRENKQQHDLRFLAQASSVPFDQVAYLFIAHKIAGKTGLRDATLFGVFSSGIPATLGAALSTLPDAGIDDAFTSQVMNGVLAHTRSSLGQVLSAAVTGNILPASYANAQDDELSKLDALRTQATGSAPYIRGKTSLSDLLAASSASESARAAFLQAYATNSALLEPTWNSLRKDLAPEDLGALSLALSSGELLDGNLILVKDALQRISKGSLSGVQGLALLDADDWSQRIGALDPDAESIPPMLKSDTPQMRIARLAKTLAERFASRYPTMALAGGLRKAEASSFDTRPELVEILIANPALELKTVNVDHYISEKTVKISRAALAELKTAQRLLRIMPDHTSVEALHKAGYQSAQRIYFRGRASFIAQMIGPLGGEPQARMAYAQSHVIYATALTAFGRYNPALNFWPRLNGIVSAAPDPGTISDFPDIQALFGSQDNFQCSDCRSVYGPAAYLVDLLHYLTSAKATPDAGVGGLISDVATALDALLVRRPDIQYIALSCDNSNITIPYIDLVNEIFESAIAPPEPPVTVIDTTGTPEERRALPQRILAAAYESTRTASFPLALPFNLSFAQTASYLAALGPSRTGLLKLLNLKPPTVDIGAALACSSLGINPEMQAIIGTEDTVDPWTRWGFAQQRPVGVVDPKTRQIFAPNDWVDALSRVPVLKDRAGLSLSQLYQLLDVFWVTQGAVALTLDVNPDNTVSADTDRMRFAGLTGDVLDRANRFLRLWTASGLQMWELDWALASSSPPNAPNSIHLDNDFLVFLAGALELRKRLDLPLQELLSFWLPIETRNVLNHLTDENTIVPSTYAAVFRNPTVLASWASVFPAAAQLSGTPVLVADGMSPAEAADAAANGNAIYAALGLTSNDIATVFPAPAAPSLDFPTLNVLLRYARLASSLSVNVTDLILWIQLTQGRPFDGTPADTIEFLRRLAVLQATGLTASDLDYLLRHNSGSQTALAFTSLQTTSVLQAVRDALSKIVPKSPIEILKASSAPPVGIGGASDSPQLTVAAATNDSPIVIETTVPHGLQTGMQVAVSGVLGNTAANGTYSIQVVDSTRLKLQGTTGSGAWTNGGTVTIMSGASYSPRLTVAAATNTSPIVIETTVPHDLQTGMQVAVSGVLGNTAANGTYSIQAVDSTRFSLQGTTGSGAWTNGGAVGPQIMITTAAPHGLQTGMRVSISGVGGNTAANGRFSIGVVNPTSFNLNGVQGNAAWTNGGTVTAEVLITTAAPHSLQSNMQVSICDVLGDNTRNFPIEVVDPATISLRDSSGISLWNAGGLVLPSIVVNSASRTSPIAVGTMTPHGLKTGMQITICGVRGNTSANGTFTVSVVDETHFTLDGSTGCGTWTSDGTVSAGIATTMQTVVIQALATATGVSANVIAPALFTAAFPLDGRAVRRMLAGLVAIDDIQFPALANIFTAAAKAAALFSALQPTESEFAFVIGNAAAFTWLSPSALPITPTAVSPYVAFEALLLAFKLNRWQRARTPKLFDVLGQWLIALPADAQTAISLPGPFASSLPANRGALPFALNSNTADVTAIATRLNAQGPKLPPAAQVGTLCDMAMLGAIADALDVVSKYGVSGATLVQAAAIPASADSADAAKSAFQSQYAPSTWFPALQQVEDTLREQRRDALVAYLLGPGSSLAPGITFLNTDDIFNYYLIDPEMCACALTTRLIQASLAIQQFVRQCFFNLTFQVTVDTSDAKFWAEWWSWRQEFRLWQANRQVFLYPENYVLPELRTDASTFFSDMGSELRQKNCNANSAESAFENYLRKLVEVSQLVVAAHCNETNPDGSSVLHVFAHTRGTPQKWFYRTRSTTTPSLGLWSPWQQLNLDIHSQHLLPVIWDRRLHLIWPVFMQISERAGDQAVPAGGGGGQSSPPPKKFWAVEFVMSELSAGQWQPKRTFAEKMFFNTPDSALAFTFRAVEDPASNLQVQVYFNAIAEAIEAATEAAEKQLFPIINSSPVVDVAFLGLGPSPIFSVTRSEFSSTATVEVSAEVLGGDLVVKVASKSAQSALVANGALSMPDAPLVASEYALILPPAPLVDVSQEPTFVLVASTNSMSGSLATPTEYGFSGQNLVYGTYLDVNSGTVPLNVLSQTSSENPAAPVPLLANIINPRVVVPQQDNLNVVSTMGPFFVDDAGSGAANAPRPARTYLVEPIHYTVSSSPREIDDLDDYQQWSNRYSFRSFYHPFSRTLLRELEIGGVPQLMSRDLQLNPQKVRGWSQSFDFNAIFAPQSSVEKPYPGAPKSLDAGETVLDFGAPGTSAPIGAYTQYNWEIFYHTPMFVASLLMQNQQYQDAMSWLAYIFNPADSSGGAAPQRFWEMAPLNQMTAATWQSQQIQTILTSGIGDAATQAAILGWMADPFDPHLVASLRIAAYGKATVMKLLDVLIAWGDLLYSQYDLPSVSQAEQMYILADLILGPRPDEVPLPKSVNAAGLQTTYASLQNLDAFSNSLVNIENLVISPASPTGLINDPLSASTNKVLPHFPKTLLFCIPPNPQLLAYWDKVAQRLYNIRHCLNLQGVAQPLPLYAPKLNPLDLAEQRAGGSIGLNAQPFTPVYRFGTYLQRAVDLTNDVRGYGALILSALEKKDAEHLAALHSGQDLNIQTLMLDVKTLQLTEALDQITALNNQKAAVDVRYQYYSKIQFMNAWETAAITLQTAALVANALAVVLDMTAGVAHMVPSFSIGVSGFGGSPTVTASYGGENIAAAVTSYGSVARSLGGILSESGGIASTMGGYQRRMDDWTMQANLAKAELTQLDSQITAAGDRRDIAQKELSIQNQQIANAQAIDDFLTGKFTNEQLYDWLLAQLTAVYTQAYQLSVSLALQAQAAYQYELGSQDQFVQLGYWDSQHKGLTAGESLLFDLKRMEAQYLASNTRERELTKQVSLALTQPLALVQLIQTGTCNIVLDEANFDRDHPGQYFRRLRSVALTFPCVAGPYTGVNATLTLNKSIIRTSPTLPQGGYVPVSPLTQSALDPMTFTAINSGMAISTSTGQNDSGLFDTNLRDERWLPFEGQGAISYFTLSLNPADNNFDISTLSDVIVHLRYTARPGIDPQTVRAVINRKPMGPRSILVSVRHTFGGAYYAFFNPSDPTAAQQTLTLPVTNALFPYSNLGSVTVSDIRIYVVLAQVANGPIPGAKFGPVGVAGKAISLVPAAGVDALGNPLAALSNSPIPALSNSISPGPVSLTVPNGGNGQMQLTASNTEDILLVFSYSVA